MMMINEVQDNLKVERVHSIPADPAAFVKIGDDWIDSGSTPVLEVLSVLVPRQKNYLINPAHPLFGAISVVESNPFALDARLVSGLAIP